MATTSAEEIEKLSASKSSTFAVNAPCLVRAMPSGPSQSGTSHASQRESGTYNGHRVGGRISGESEVTAGKGRRLESDGVV